MTKEEFIKQAKVIEDLIGVDALDRETCEFCKEDYPIISWFRCENCVILK